jgi:hypothetical protein
LENAGYQALLLDQVSVLNAYVRKLHESTGRDFHTGGDDSLDVTENGRYVLMEYSALYEVTSTLSAVVKLVNPWPSKCTGLESTLKRPLQGDSETSE